MSESTSSDNPAPGTDQARQEAELIGRIIQSEQKLSDYFTTIITKSVTDQLERRSVMRLRLIGVVVVSLLTVAIPGMLSWVRGTIAEQTEHALGAQFDLATTQLEARFEDFLDQERMYSSFTNHLLYLSERRSVPRSEMTELRVRLEELAKYPSIIARAEFPYLADLVVRLAVKQGDKATLELLETDLSNVLTSVRTKPRLARYYGERVLGDRFTSEAKRQSVARRFQQYVDASEHSPDFETLLPLQLMVDDALNVEGLDEILNDIRFHVRDLGPQDQASFIAETVRYSNPQFWEAPTTARTRRVAGVAGQVVIEQRDFYIDLLDSVAVQTALIDIAEANNGNTAFATALSGFRNGFSGELASTDDKALLAAIATLIHTDIDTWMQDDVIVDAVKAQNRRTADFSRQRIQDLESQWQSEFESGAYDLIEGVQERAISRQLRRVKRDSVGMYHEIHVMDGIGLIVGASDPNDDYWQGDEEKWQNTFQAGRGSMHIGKLKFDSSALAWEMQISLPVLDPKTGTPIGAITIGVDPSALESS